MSSPRRPKPSKRKPVVWERPEPARRPAPAPLSREAIVAAAIALADAEGLESVSLRKVGAALDAGPMRLYGYVSTKEELLSFMVDAVYAEIPLGKARGDWRKTLRTLSQRVRRAALQHPWFTDLLGGRPHIGPHALAHLEASLAALSEVRGFEGIDAVLQAASVLNAFVIGALRSEASDLRAERDSGKSEAEWQLTTGPYLERIIETGKFPSVSRVIRQAAHPSADERFERGLDTVLDGIALSASTGAS